MSGGISRRKMFGSLIYLAATIVKWCTNRDVPIVTLFHHLPPAFKRSKSLRRIQLPSISIAVTMTLVSSAKTQKVRCVVRPKRARITCRKVLVVQGIESGLVNSEELLQSVHICRHNCRKVLAPGAYSLSCTTSIENRRIWIVAPDAYQNAPLMPY